jgi:hypothetical protein
MKSKKNIMVLLLTTVISVGTIVTHPSANKKVSSAGHQSSGNEKIVFEEVGQFNDGGMAVTVLVIDNTAYVCEFDGFQVVGDLIFIADGTDGLEIVRFKKMGKLNSSKN